jgi:RecG-like helicase
VAKVPAGSQVGDSSRARQATQQRIVDELAAGGSVFWVFPLVNESENFEGMASANQARQCKLLWLKYFGKPPRAQYVPEAVACS